MGTASFFLRLGNLTGFKKPVKFGLEEKDIVDSRLQASVKCLNVLLLKRIIKNWRQMKKEADL